MTIQRMIEKFQCPGCVLVEDTSRKSLSRCATGCTAHVAGTAELPGGLIYAGLPVGFNKVGQALHTNIRLYCKGTSPTWDEFNVPVWYLVEGGYLFVRTFLPRLNQSYVDVVEGGTAELLEGHSAIDVAELKNQMG